MNLETRLDNLYEDPQFGWFTKQASTTTAILGSRHSLSPSTVWEHMKKNGIKTGNVSTRHREGCEGLIHDETGPLFYSHMLSCWPRSAELGEHVAMLLAR